ncbi:MAG: riboflavin synthase [Bacteroidetes bacterium]|nr:riboflavin synthase [Bacteroidota bacterium]
MFTGIIEEVGIVRSITKGAKSVSMLISADVVASDLRLGDSVNTNGTCLTVTGVSLNSFTVDVMPETMRKTNLGSLKAGSNVNLERALLLSSRLGGHLVSGHIDGTGLISKIKKEDNAVWITLQASPDILRYLIPRGSVSLDGISLTVVHADEVSFEVSLIPHSMAVTTLRDKKPGDTLNIECDMVAKYIEKYTVKAGPGSTIDQGFLDKYGF